MKKLSIYFVLLISFFLVGCTATSRFKGPNYVFDDKVHNSPIPKSTQIGHRFSLIKSCSEAHSVHSPIIWLPIAGPLIDMFLVADATELSSVDILELVPLVGPPIVYLKGSQYCSYYNLTLEGHLLNDVVSPEVVKEAIATSDRNCYTYQRMMVSGFNEFDANQKILADSATYIQTGASFANPVIGAVIGGIKASVTSANDAIKIHFFESWAAPQIFENVGAIRKVMLSELQTINPGFTRSKWGYKSNELNGQNGMILADLRRFMESYDKTCFFDQAVADLNITTDSGQGGLRVKQEGTTSSSDLRRDVLINNNATPLQ